VLFSDFEYIEECSEENEHPLVTDPPQDEQDDAAIKLMTYPLPFYAFLIISLILLFSILLNAYLCRKVYLSRRKKVPAGRCM